MSVSLFEGFRRFNKVVLVIISITGILLAYDKASSSNTQQMATYEITAPDGSIFEITAPDSASEKEVMDYTKQQFGQSEESTEQYAQWIVDNQAKKGTLEFNMVAEAYKQSKVESPYKIKLRERSLRQHAAEQNSNKSKVVVFMTGIGWTLLIILGYWVACKGIRYLAKGFVGEDG